MTDYNEEQSNEIEALESIYPAEFTVIEVEPFYKFRINVKSSDYEEEEEIGAAIDIIFTYTAHYPDEAPVIEIDPILNLEEEYCQRLKNILEEQCIENLGMVMVFTLVSFSQEWLDNKLSDDQQRMNEVEESKKRAEDEEERKKFEGERVTVETFLAWKIKFDSERFAASGKTKEVEKVKKLTGKELFLKDITLNESDLNFIGGDDEVAVDESLFQDMDDLDLDDEDLDFSE